MAEDLVASIRQRFPEEHAEKKSAATPQGFECNDKGVFVLKEDKDGNTEKLPITQKPVRVTALSRDVAKENWGRLVRWVDHDGHEHEQAIPANLFHATNGGELISTLASGGLPIVAGREKDLMRYLCVAAPPERLVAATSTGWHGEAFVLPGETINQPDGERIVFQPAGLSNVSKAIHRKGTLIGWQAAIEEMPPIGIFNICASLSSPLRFLAEVEAGGFHNYGRTSTGKTTTLQGAASVWGDGVDPSHAGGREAVIQRWNSTSNALEAKAEAFNDLPLVVDEIGEGEAKSFGQTIYRILSGTGRARAKRDGSLANSKAWRTMIISAGELPVSQYIEEGGSKARGGQLVRLVDIPFDNGFTSGKEADLVKRECARHYGHAGPALLESGDLMSSWSDFDHEQIGHAVTNEAGRVRKRFALAAYAGVLGVEREILPWTVEQVIEATRSAYAGWLTSSDGVSDVERGVENVVDFLLAHGASRFEQQHDQHVTRDRAGWFRDGMYHFTPKAFREACAGAPDKDVKKALRERGLLHTNRQGTFTATIRVDGQTTNVVSVRASVLSIDTDAPDAATQEQGASPENKPWQGPTHPTQPTQPQNDKPEEVAW